MKRYQLVAYDEAFPEARVLHFIGPAAAVSFGPMMRFTFGARYAARRLTRVLVNARRVPQTKISAVSKVSTPAGTGF